MGRVFVRGAEIQDGRIQSMKVAFGNLPERVIDRETALQWMKDSHSFLPPEGPALLLVEVGEELFIRADSSAEAADSMPQALS